MMTARFERGKRLELAGRSWWRLVQGEVLVHLSGRPVEVWRAPCWLDVTGTLAEQRRVSFSAVTDVVLSEVAREELSWREVTAAIAEEAERLWTRVDADVRRDDDMFLPHALPVPGPWHFRRATVFVLVVQGNAGALPAALPRGVRLLPGLAGRYLLLVARFREAGSLDERDSGRFGYHEVTPIIPVWSGLRAPAGFIPELYPDSWMATILGREIHGFPKRTARIGFYEDGAELIVDRQLALRVRVAARRQVTTADAMGHVARTLSGSRWIGSGVMEAARRRGGDFAFDVLVHKRIADVASAGRALALDEVNRVRMELDPIVRAELLEGLTAELPTAGVVHGDVLGGVLLETGLRFGAGDIERRRGSR